MASIEIEGYFLIFLVIVITFKFKGKDMYLTLRIQKFEAQLFFNSLIIILEAKFQDLGYKLN